MPSPVAAGALALAIAVALAICVTFPIVVTSLTPRKSFVQNGNVTWDLYNATALDSVQSTYRLYQMDAGYVLELDVLSRDLLVPTTGATATVSIRVRIRDFTPAVVPLGTYGTKGYIIPLSQSNSAAIVPDGPCFDPPTPTCNLDGVSGSPVLTADSVAFDLEGSKGYMYFYMQTLSGQVQDWSNYTLGTSSRLYFHLFSV